jgi:hypothetical protein
MRSRSFAKIDGEVRTLRGRGTVCASVTAADGEAKEHREIRAMPKRQLL